MSRPSVATTVSIRITEKTAADPVRKRVSVPPSDSVVLDWWAAQTDPGISVRLLIHEEVQAHGSIDRVNRIGLHRPDPSPSPTLPPSGASSEIASALAQLHTLLGDNWAPVLEALANEARIEIRS